MRPFRFAGPYLAYPRKVSVGCGPDVCDWSEVVVADLRPTKRLVVRSDYAMSDEAAKEFDAQESVDAVAFLTDLVLRPSGAVAWIECDGAPDPPCDPDNTAQTSLFVATPQKRSRTKLDEGAGIDRRSLRWAKGRFRWRHDGQPRSAAYG